MRLGVGLAAAMFVLGCESGTEVTTVGSATAVRQADGKVVVTVKTTCFVVAGQPRVTDDCDSDGEEACFHADWVEQSEHATKVQSVPATKLMTARECKEIKHVRTSGVATLTSPSAVPTDRKLNIVLYADDQFQNSGAAVVIESP